MLGNKQLGILAITLEIGATIIALVSGFIIGGFWIIIFSILALIPAYLAIYMIKDMINEK